MLPFNKNNMQQTLTPKPLRRSILPKENSFPRPTYKTTYNRHILNLDITQNISYPANKYKTVDSNYKTAYNTTNISWKAAHIRHPHKAERGAVTPEHGHAVVGTPFTSLEVGENESGNGAFAMTEREHYRYLVKAISRLKRGRQLYDTIHRFKDSHNPQNTRLYAYESRSNRYTAGHPFTGVTPSYPHPVDHEEGKNGICTSPKIVNISAQIKSRKGMRSSMEAKGNPFQNIFKNKRRLQSKYYQGRVEAQSDFEMSILGDQELKIHHIGWAKAHQQRKQP